MFSHNAIQFPIFEVEAEDGSYCSQIEIFKCWSMWITISNCTATTSANVFITSSNISEVGFMRF